MNVEIQRDGLTLRGILNTPKTDKFDLVVLMHGFTADKGDEPGSLLYELADGFEKQGMGTLRFDFNGHGQSDGEFKNMTVLNELGDANAILNYARSIKGIEHLYLVGHSQGGVVASMMAGYYPDKINKLVLLSPAATLKDDSQKGELQGSKYDRNNIPDELNILGGKTVGGFYLRTAQNLPIYEVAKLYKGPVCLIHGTDDEIVNNIASQRYSDTYFNSELHLIPDADHIYSVGNTMEKAVQVATDFLK